MLFRIVENSPRMMNARGHTWQRVLSMTLQPRRPLSPPKEGESFSDKPFI